MKAVRGQNRHVIEQLTPRFPKAPDLLDEVGPDLPAFSGLPTAHWHRIWSDNPLKRLNRKIRCRADVVGILPKRAAVIRLVGTFLAEQHDELAVTRRYLPPLTLTSSAPVVFAPLAQLPTPRKEVPAPACPLARSETVAHHLTGPVLALQCRGAINSAQVTCVGRALASCTV